MGMTMTEKILAAHAGLKTVKAGQLIQAKLDLVVSTDATFPVSLKPPEGGLPVLIQKVVLVMDHFANKDIKAAENCRLCREFALETNLGSNF